MKTLQYVNLDICEVGKVHPIWQCGTDPIQVGMATTKARLLVQCYSLHGTHCAGRNKAKQCPLCHGPEETTEHFILECSYLEERRALHMKEIIKEI